MEDTLKDNVLILCRTLIDLKADSVVGMKMNKTCSWASFLIIATVRSRQHLHSLSSELIPSMRDMGMSVSPERKNPHSLTIPDERMWGMIDGGEIVLSLMGRKARNFYSLEDIWYEAEVIYRQDEYVI